MALIAIAVGLFIWPVLAVLAGLDPAIHENTAGLI
jgi:hypothetical protein